MHMNKIFTLFCTRFVYLRGMNEYVLYFLSLYEEEMATPEALNESFLVYPDVTKPYLERRKKITGKGIGCFSNTSEKHVRKKKRKKYCMLFRFNVEVSRSINIRHTYVYNPFLLLEYLGLIGLHCASVHIRDSMKHCLLLSEPYDVPVYN